ncbi:hypothetical protein JOL62DRAFT_314658 [Phyllosticta paracitricarpa]|uniref:Uncharacterized protein n=1 Tax=Phyllosticta paracitricarpa TaxID=2016321 RepID=A0ABR1MVB3_9PEZI
MGWAGRGGGWLDWVGLARQMSEKEAIANSMLVSHNARAHCLDARLLLACLLAWFLASAAASFLHCSQSSVLYSKNGVAAAPFRRQTNLTGDKKRNKRQEGLTPRQAEPSSCYTSSRQMSRYLTTALLPYRQALPHHDRLPSFIPLPLHLLPNTDGCPKVSHI